MWVATILIAIGLMVKFERLNVCLRHEGILKMISVDGVIYIFYITKIIISLVRLDSYILSTHQLILLDKFNQKIHNKRAHTIKGIFCKFC
jgi:hypothetical protein